MSEKKQKQKRQQREPKVVYGEAHMVLNIDKPKEANG